MDPGMFAIPQDFERLKVDEYPFDLGSGTRPINTKSRDCQIWFDRGLLWTYGFNHEEAVRCFRHAILADPKATMAYWGYAYALGPNYNQPFDSIPQDQLPAILVSCHRACQLAIDYAQDSIERGLAEALILRFPQDQSTGSHKKWTLQWGDAMRQVYEASPDDLDLATIYADSRMNVAAWQLWDIPTGEPNQEAHTLEARNVLERALKNPLSRKHAGVLHLWIHLMELSPEPELAIVPGDYLRDLVPDSGHLHHMPTHIDVLIGDYRRAIASNWDGIYADAKYMQHSPDDTAFYTVYRLHNMSFVAYAAMFSGQFSHAYDAAVLLEQTLPERVLRSGQNADWFESVYPTKIHVLVRFGKWDEILGLDFPKDARLYSVTTATLHYARGIAHSIQGNIQEAKKEQKLLAKTRLKIPPGRRDFINECADILKVGEAMLSGELEYRKANFDFAFSELRRAIELCDNLIYSEPWGWMQPPRHAYAALLMEQGRIEEATEVYAADLGYSTSLPRAHRHPRNVWALHGYYEGLVRLGQAELASIVKVELDQALAVAEVEITASCACRTQNSDLSSLKSCCKL